MRASSRARKEKKSLSQSLVISFLSTTARSKPPPAIYYIPGSGPLEGSDQVIAGSAGDEVLLPFPEFGILEKVPARAAGHGVGAPPGSDEVASRPA